MGGAGRQHRVDSHHRVLVGVAKKSWWQVQTWLIAEFADLGQPWLEKGVATDRHPRLVLGLPRGFVHAHLPSATGVTTGHGGPATAQAARRPALAVIFSSSTSSMVPTVRIRSRSSVSIWMPNRLST